MNYTMIKDIQLRGKEFSFKTTKEFTSSQPLDKLIINYCDAVAIIRDTLDDISNDTFKVVMKEYCDITNVNCILSKDEILTIVGAYNGIYISIDIKYGKIKDVNKLDEIEVIVGEGGYIPERAFPTDAGLDLRTPCDFVINAHDKVRVDTYVSVNIPAGYVGKLESKSGLMHKSGITCRGTIDAGYSGTICAVLFNSSDRAVTFEKGQKITQLVIYPIATPVPKIVESFKSESNRGMGGFGSTGR